MLEASRVNGARRFLFSNSDNSLLRKVLTWDPRISLEDGLAATYRWIEGELIKAGRIRERVATAAK